MPQPGVGQNTRIRGLEREQSVELDMCTLSSIPMALSIVDSNFVSLFSSGKAKMDQLVCIKPHTCHVYFFEIIK